MVPFGTALSPLRYADYWALSATGLIPLLGFLEYVATATSLMWWTLPNVLLLAGQYWDILESESDHSGDFSDEELVERSFLAQYMLGY